MRIYKSQKHFMKTIKFILALAVCLLLISNISCVRPAKETNNSASLRERISLNDNWRYFKYNSLADDLIYDNRPEVSNYIDNRPADSKPDEALALQSAGTVLKPWILPSGNDFISDPDNHYERPEGNPGNDFPFVLDDFDDSSWTLLNLPHDWAVEGPFYEAPNPVVGGGMGLALVIVRSHKDDYGKIKLTVKSDGLESSSVIINSRSAVR